VRIAILMHGAPRPHPLIGVVRRRLEDRGATVELLYPDHRLTDPGRVRVNHDLYVLKSGSELALSLAGALHAAGASILNPYPVAALCRDKIVATHVLRAAGLPVPDAWVTDDPARLAPLLGAGPIVIKPYRGSGGAGVRIVRTEPELASVAPAGGPLLAQRFHEPDDCDRKIYRIGERVFGVKRVWPARTYLEKLGEPFVPGDELRQLAQRCAEAIGAAVLGFDVVVSRGRPYVVDISSFPGFKGVGYAAAHLAVAIEDAAVRAGAARLEAVAEAAR